MGMFDSIFFDKPYICSQCGAEIASTQTKAFDQSMSSYEVKDCIYHAEDIRIVKEELFCDKCKFIGQHVYLAVVRGILVGVADTLQAAQGMLNDLNLEKTILWYHDLFKRYRAESREKQGALNFMGHVVEWFGKGYHKLKEEETKQKLLFIWDNEYLKDAKDPLEAIKRYVAEKNEEGV